MATPNIDLIFRDPTTRHELTIFSADDLDWLESRISSVGGKLYVECYATEKQRPAKPEEVVRQLWLREIIDRLHYPRDRIQVERPVWFGSGVADKSADIVVLQNDKEHPYIVFEVKKPKRKDGLQQLKSYCNAEGSPIGVWSNGGSTIVLHREEPNVFVQISTIPALGQTLQSVIAEPWTLDKLIENDRLETEHLSLRRVITDLEDLVLANSGEDAFEEVFKLLYAKLYDEWAAENIPARARAIQFRIYGESPDELAAKIAGLFQDARNKWRDIFESSDRIMLSPGHLLTCVSFLQDIRLFNANLQVIDDAFEYLITQVAKGSKGQYFTPRWVIDACVKMLNPTASEYVIDPAAGSSGFLLHTIIFIGHGAPLSSGLPAHVREFAQENVFAIDFDAKAIKVSKAMNLIAGDGKSHVFKDNSLDPPNWHAPLTAALSPFRADKDDSTYQDLTFDVLLTNPPFAGQVQERDILRQYNLSEKGSGKTAKSMGRDVLFIERCLHMLKPGGRMAIVLPQGRFTNTTDLYIRTFIRERARILAVVGLHPNSFKPHTGTKVSILFLQKHSDEMLATIAETRTEHSAQLSAHLDDLRASVENPDLSMEALPPVTAAQIEIEFTDADADEESEEAQTSEALPSAEELSDRIAELSAMLEEGGKRFKGRADLVRALLDTRKALASRTINGRLDWLLTDPPALGRYEQEWLSMKADEDLSYEIFFAVSERGGKDNSGNTIFQRDASGAFIETGDGRVIDHDLDEIAEAFLAFARDQGLAFV